MARDEGADDGQAPGDEKQPLSTLRSPSRLLKILHVMAEGQGEPRTLARISTALGAPKTSTFSLLRALCQDGYLQMRGSSYVLGDASFALASLISAARGPAADVERLPGLAEPFIQQLAERSGETVFISALTRERDEAVYIARAESKHPIRFMANVGERRPLYSSSGGRALLAYLPPEEQEAYIAQFKPRKTARNTSIDARALRSMIATTRKTGVATTSNDTHVGVSAWASPIFSRDGRAVAALIIAAPSERSEPKGAAIVELLQTCALSLSRLLGFRPDAL